MMYPSTVLVRAITVTTINSSPQTFKSSTTAVTDFAALGLFISMFYDELN
jgi:hypothetical protein